jgi:hypothetical protein
LLDASAEAAKAKLKPARAMRASLVMESMFLVCWLLWLLMIEEAVGWCDD